MRTRKIRRITVPVILAVSSLSFGAGSSSASSPGSNGLIAFAFLEHGGSEVAGIAVIQPDGGGFQLLTDPNGYREDVSPAWSADGSTIAFVREDWSGRRTDLWTIDSEGGNPTRLTRTRRPEYCPAWSPDGDQLVFMRLDRSDYDFDLWVMDVMSGVETRLTDTSRTRETCPDWSPDGSTIVFARERGTRYSRLDIATVEPDGTNRRVLAKTRMNEFGPSWSPDGTRILYEARPLRNFGDAWIESMAADGGDQEIILKDEDRDYFSPEYAPAGDQITFWWEPRAGTAIFVVRVDGFGLTRVTQKDPQTENLDPAWQPIVT